jgi:hypothetical protein
MSASNEVRILWCHSLNYWTLKRHCDLPLPYSEVHQKGERLLSSPKTPALAEAHPASRSMDAGGFEVAGPWSGPLTGPLTSMKCVDVTNERICSTFRGPCIVIYCYNKSQRGALFLNLILVKNSTCFGQIYWSVREQPESVEKRSLVKWKA